MDTFESKVRVTIPDYIIEILHTDMYDFDLSKNALCNRIFFAFYLTEREIIYSQVKSQAVKILQFTLNHENLDILIDSFPKQLIQSKADYFRRIIFEFVTFLMIHLIITLRYSNNYKKVKS